MGQIILLVEDDPNDEELTRLAFEENNIANEIVVARDGAEALEYLFGTGKYAGRDLSVMPQLIMLDLNLPKVSGIEVLKKLRDNERTKFLPVVIFTSSREERDMIEGYRFGANAYVQKPIEFSDFTAAVRQLGLFWVVWNRSVPLPPFTRGVG